MTVHSLEKQYSCICGYKTAHKFNLKKHIKICLKMFNCNCGFSTRNGILFNTHTYLCNFVYNGSKN